MVSATHNLPVQTTPFIGRQKEIAAIAGWLDDASHRLVTILGPGGMGKTRLALAVADGQLAGSRFNDGIFFVPLAGVENSERIAPVIAEAMQLRLEQGEPQLLNYLRARRVLLVLDNFEQLVEGSELISRLLEAAPQVQILVTSRERLRLHREQVYPILGLSVDDEAMTGDARQLFLQAARQTRPNFQPSTENTAQLKYICQLVEGMPLALELAATWIDVLSLDDIAAEIARNLAFLETDVRDVPARHRSMRAVFETTWRKLSAEHQQLLARLSVFRGGFSRRAAEEVANTSLRHLGTLVNKSLLRFDRAANRYHVHELLRQYAAGKLTSTSARDRHATHYIDWLLQQSKTLTSSKQTEAITRIEKEMDNIRAAVDHALLRRTVNQFIPLMRTLCTLFYKQSRLQEGARLCNQIRAELLSAPETYVRTRFWATAWLTLLTGSMGRATASHDLLRQLRSTLTDLESAMEDTRAERAMVFYIEGYGLYTEQPARARRLHQQSYDLQVDVGDLFGAAQAMNALAKAARNDGDLMAAEVALGEALRLYRDLGDPEEIIQVQSALGNLAAIAGRYDEAERLLLASVSAARSINRTSALSSSLRKLQTLYYFSGRFEEAGATLVDSQTLYEKRGWAWGLAQASIAGGALLLHQGLYREAVHAAQESISMVSNHGMPTTFTCEALAIQAQGEIALQNINAAEAQLRQSNRLCESRPPGEYTFVAGNPLYYGIAAAARGDVVEAWLHLRKELEAAVARKDRLNLANALAGVAYLHTQEGNPAAALKQYAIACQHPFVANSRWFADVVGQPVLAATERLSPVETEAVRQHGGEADLETTAIAILAQTNPGAAEGTMADTPSEQSFVDPLSERELELLRLVASGKSNREIAEELFLALGTVKSHLHNIFQKLDVRSRTQATARARKLDLL